LKFILPPTLFQRFVPNVLVVYALMVAAFAFYALSVPERFSPGLI
jgi:hypothetical protein